MDNLIFKFWLLGYTLDIKKVHPHDKNHKQGNATDLSKD
jgi:hypothetical protein